MLALSLTPLYTIDKTSAVSFTISFWRSEANLPVLHVSAWSMLYFAFWTHFCGKCLCFHQYLSKNSSKNSGVVDENLSCFNGRDDNHNEAPSDVAISLAFNWAGVIFL